MKILYVEDNPHDVMQVQRELARQKAGFELTHANTLSAARLHLEQALDYDLVLADLKLPDGSGLDLLAEIRYKALPLAVVILTGRGDEETAVAALKAGANDYLVKRNDHLARLPLILETALKQFHTEASRMEKPLNVLYAEHNPADVNLTRHHLARYAPHIHLEAVNSAAAFVERLVQNKGDSSETFDLLLLDYRLPGTSGFDLLKLLRHSYKIALPIILVTGHGDEETATQSLRLGAADYLTKNPGYLFRLPAVLENAYHRHLWANEAAKLHQKNKHMAFLLELSNTLASIHKTDELLQVITDGAADFMGLGSAAIYLLKGTGLRLEATCPPLPPGFPENLRNVEQLNNHPHIQQALSSMHPVILADTNNAILTPGEKEVCERRHLRSLLYIPLCNQGKAMGVLIVGSVNQPRFFTDDEIKLCQALANQAALQIVETRLYEEKQAYIQTIDEGLKKQKQIEMLLIASEERYRRLAENAPDIVYRINMFPERHFEYVNPAATAITGYTPEEHYADPDLGYKLVHPGDRHLLNQAAEGELSPDRPLVLRWLRKDGKKIWTEQRNVPIYDEQGTLIAIEGVARDITKRKEAEEKLKTNYALLKLAGETAKFGGWSVDLAENRVIWSDEVAAIHDQPKGYSPLVEEGISYYAPRWREKITRILTACAEQGVPYDERMEIITAKGTRKWVRTIGEAIKDASGKVVKVQGAFQDITAQLKAEEALHSRLNELEVLYTTSSSLRTADALDDMLALLLDETLNALGTEAGAICLYHRTDRHLRFTVTRGWFNTLDDAFLKPGEGIGGTVYLTNQVFVSDELAKDASPKYADLIPNGWIGAAVPIHLDNEPIGVLYIAKSLPFTIDQAELQLLISLTDMAGTAIHRLHLFEELQHSNQELMHAYDATIESLARSLELRDFETEGHCRRVVDLTLELALLLKIPEEQLVHIQRGALLHDIGKIAIADSILLKPGSLTEEEWELMRQHPVYAYDLIKPVEYLRPALDIPYCHHEKWDGSGYPRGLKGKNIPLSARIFAVVDVYDALTSDRPYRKAWNREEALQYIQEESGKHFDPEVVKAFLQRNV